jgi:hypothetical protein
MGFDMLVRDLYLPAGTTLDLAAATATVSRLCRTASLDDLRTLLDTDVLTDAGVAADPGWAEHALLSSAPDLRAAAEQQLHRQLHQFAASLSGRDVARFRFDSDAGTGVEAYVTGGLSWGDSPTDAYDRWDIVYDTDQLPPGWADQIGAALGLLHPRGDGPAATTVTFHAWAVATTEDATNR